MTRTQLPLAVALCLLLVGAPSVRSDEGMAEGGGYGGDDDEGYGGGMGGGGYGGDDYGGGEAPSTPAFTLLEDVAAIDKFVKDVDTEPAVVGIFNAETNKADVEAFEAFANEHRYDLRFAYATDAAVVSHFKATSGCAVHVYKPAKFVSDKYDKPKARFPGKGVDGPALLKFVNKKALPLVGQKTWKSNTRYEAAKLPVLTLFVKVDLEKDPKGYEYYANRVRRVAVDFADQLLFNIGDKEDFSYLLTDYGLELPGKKDMGAGIKYGANHYAMTEAFSVDNLRAFVEAFKAGSLVPKVKEEKDLSHGHDDEDGGDEDDGTPSEVIDLTNDNFKDVVMAPGTNVMVEFYAPWCGHCMQLKPVYKKVAAAFKGNAGVTVAAMDATASDIPAGFNVEGYPTIFFVKAGAKDTPVPYEGGRDYDSMVEFIKANSATTGEL